MAPTFLESVVRDKHEEALVVRSCCVNGGKHWLLWKYLEMEQNTGWGDQDGFPEKLTLKLNLKR